MKTLMEIRDLHISFHRLGQTLQAVRGVDLIVREGETLGIVGESGIGQVDARPFARKASSQFIGDDR